MNRIHTLLIALLLMVGSTSMAQVADSVDVLDYDLDLDFSRTDGTFSGCATLQVALNQPCSDLMLMLTYQPDSVRIGTQQAPFTHLGSKVYIPLSDTPDTLLVTLFYHGTGYVEGGGWGGLHMDADMYYNLGVAFSASPHSVARMLFPCRENFYDKATYTLRIKSRAGWTAQCGGMLQQRSFDAEGCEHTVWRIGHPTPPYLVSMSTADWHRINTTVQGVDSTYPLCLGFTTQDSIGVVSAFAELDSVVPMFERCFGPYRWGRIGYIATEKGSMESVNNIALDRTFMDNITERGQSTIAHELGHAWFGNLITCTTEGDMWINEGGASFCSEVAMEATSGKAAATDYYQTNLSNVVRTTHITDYSYLALHDMPALYTYGSTTYDKGALVWHSLRGVVGDSLFYAAMRRLMSEKAFGNVDADALRDSMEAYTGRDLTHFFDFHVKQPGFVSYHIEATQQAGVVSVRMRPQPVGTTTLPASHRLPVSFFAADGHSQTLCFDFDSTSLDGDYFVASASLPFNMQYYVMDYECALSDAATLDEAKATAQPMSKALPHVFMSFRTMSAADSGHYVIEHRWGKPYGLDSVPGVRRTALRYWVVSGSMAANNTSQGYFYLVKGTNSTSNYAYLDQGFYMRNSEYDSIRLMYRPNASSTWQVMPTTRMGNTNQFIYVSSTLPAGEYAFATVDTATLSVATPSDADNSFRLFPNPLPSGAALHLDIPTDIGDFTLTVIDSTGRIVRHLNGCTAKQEVALELPAGRYLVRIENKCVTLHSNLIQL